MATTATHPSPRALALKAEWTKLRTLRSTWITAAISIAAAAALGALAAGSDARNWDGMSAAERAAFDPTSTSLVGVLFGALVLGALGVRSMTAEYATGMIRTTAAAIPRRGRFLWSKVAILAIVSFGAAVLANALGFTIGQALLSEQGIGAPIADSRSLGAIILGAVAVGAFAVIGVALGTIVRRASVANILMALVVIGGSLIGSVMPAASQKYLPFNALKATVSVEPAPDLLEPVVALGVVVAYPVVLLTAAAVLLRRRDV